MSSTPASIPPTFRETLPLWLKIGLISFGGPAAQIALLQEELVERRRWIDQRTFLTALNFCMLLPGPEAQQLATFVGYRLHGLRGAVAAGGLFVLPGALVLFGLAWLAAAHGSWPPLAAIFKGLLPVVAALVAHAVWRIGGRILKSPIAWLLAAGAFVALEVLHLGFPWIVLAAGLTGAVCGWKGWRIALDGHEALPPPATPASRIGPVLLRLFKLAAAFTVLWAAPFALILLLFGREPFEAVGLFFSQAAFVTFGGAYAVLPYVAEAAVEQQNWLSAGQMAHGLALAETTPGPLILVTQFVGFFAGWNASLSGATPLGPLAAASLAAGLTTWVTFLPSFFFILAGGPLVERLQGQAWAAGALAAITAAVVGVIATLGVTMARLAFLPEGGPDLIALAVGVAAFAALARWKVNTLWLVAVGGAVGLIRLALPGL